MMMYDITLTYKRRKLVKTYKKKCSLENGPSLLKYARRPTPKIYKKGWSTKTSTDVKNKSTN